MTTTVYPGHTTIKANSDLDALVASVAGAAAAGSSALGQWGPTKVVGAFVGRNFTYRGGSAIDGTGTVVVIANGSLLVADNAVSYVERDVGGTVSTNTGGFTAGRVPMAKVTAAGGAITVVEDWRPMFGPFTYFGPEVGETGVVDTRFPYGDVRRYGWVGDAVVLTDAAIAAGTPALTAASGAFVGLDAGKTIQVQGAGPAGGVLTTTILARTGAGAITLAANASTTVGGAIATYGTLNHVALQAAIDGVRAGSELSFPSVKGLVTTQINLNKKLKWRGEGAGEGGGSSLWSGSAVVGTGFTIVRATEPFLLEDIQILDPIGHANTIGLDINDGANGVSKWGMRGAYITTNHVAKLGTGVRCIFGLEGVFDGGALEGWSNGLDLQSIGGQKSNANALTGVKLRVCTIGVKMTDVDNLMMMACTNEGCAIGVSNETGHLVTFGNHFENNQGVQWQIHTTGTGSISSFGDMFYQGAADLAVFIESGASVHYFASPLLNIGIKHTGTGIVTLAGPVNAVTTAGTGPIVQTAGTGFNALQGMTGQVISFAGYAFISTALNIINSAGASKIGGLTGVQFTDQNANVKAHIDALGVMFPQQTTAGIYSGAGSPEGVVTASPGSPYLRTNGGALTSLYVKETGIGNTGWVAK